MAACSVCVSSGPDSSVATKDLNSNFLYSVESRH